MAAQLRFYLDENVPIAVARQLQARGIEVVTVPDLGLLGASDEMHLAKATQMGYVLCIYDTDTWNSLPRAWSTLGLFSVSKMPIMSVIGSTGSR